LTSTQGETQGHLWEAPVKLHQSAKLDQQVASRNVYSLEVTAMSNQTAVQLWEQLFQSMAKAVDATLIDPEYDDSADETRLRVALARAGWSEAEIEARINFHKTENARAPVTSPGVAPQVETQFDHLCDDVEAAMDRLGFDSHARVARGVEPRIGPHAAMTNVVMTDQSIVTVGSFLFRFCGLVARAFARTLLLDPGLWENQGYRDTTARELLRSAPMHAIYWLQIFISYAVTGTHFLVPFRPANKHEVLLFEQVARAMEIFAISHEYGHHHHGHGRQLGDDPKREELDADQFALRIGYEVERTPLIIPNPYLSSGAGGVVLLMALDTLGKFRGTITGAGIPSHGTHPTATERLSRFDSVALLDAVEFAQLKGFRTASARILASVDAELSDLLSALPADVRDGLRNLAYR
jgi:hypothetical protein